MKNCSCPICYEHQSANEYYRMTVHTNAYHSLIEKIHEKITKLEKEPYHPMDIKQVKGKHFLKPEDIPEICFLCIGHQETIIELKSLLEDEK